MSDDDYDDLVEYGYGGSEEEAIINNQPRPGWEELYEDRSPDVVAHFDVCTCTDMLLLGSDWFTDDCKCNPPPPMLLITYHYDTDTYHTELPMYVNPDSVQVSIGRLFKRPEVKVEGKELTMKGWSLETSMLITLEPENWHQRARRTWK